VDGANRIVFNRIHVSCIGPRDRVKGMNKEAKRDVKSFYRGEPSTLQMGQPFEKGIMAGSTEVNSLGTKEDGGETWLDEALRSGYPGTKRGGAELVVREAKIWNLALKMRISFREPRFWRNGVEKPMWHNNMGRGKIIRKENDPHS